MISLPGTTIRVPDPPPIEGAIAFGSGGSASNGQTFIPWSIRGRIPKTQFQRGDTIVIDATISTRIEIPADASVQVDLSLTPLSGPDGASRLAQRTYASTFMTPTELPIERKQWLYTYYQSSVTGALTPAGAAPVSLSLPVHDDLPDGFYRPAINVRFSNNISGRPVAGQPFFTFIDNATRESPFRHLPLILRVGNPQPPRLLFALLMNETLQAQRGVVAIEDRARFGIAPHIAVVADPRSSPMAAGGSTTCRSISAGPGFSERRPVRLSAEAISTFPFIAAT